VYPYPNFGLAVTVHLRAEGEGVKVARSKRVVAGAAAVSVVIGGGALFATPSNADTVAALTGQCGVEDASGGASIGSDGNLTYSQTSSGNDRVARFLFVGTSAGANYGFTSYKYRYAVNDTESFGPQSNENIRFGEERNSPSDKPYASYASPDDHNSNLPYLPDQSLVSNYVVQADNFEIWVQAIFDVPGTPDPNCWTNAVRSK
jgi:hypothetical protein